MKYKTTIIGAGNVGASIAQLIAFHGMGDVILLDIEGNMAKGKALDIAEACPIWNSASQVSGTSDFSDIKNSNIVIITAGIARKPGMSRDDLLNVNADIVRNAAVNIAKYCPDSIVIVVTNPMDVMTQLVFSVTGFTSNKVLGMGGILDSSRFKTFIAMELKVSPSIVNTMVLGGHGDQMLPLPRFTTVGGIPLTELMSADKINELIKRTASGGAEIVKLLEKGSAFYAPAASVFQMIKAIIFDEKLLIPAACYLNGEYGFKGVYSGVPVIIGASGAERIIEIDLNENEKKDFANSVTSVRESVSKLNL
ncbi:MAG: malate dehydrogenase [Nitrospirae bacterium]|nr:malate dehydrogenase [Nitrospirota bacterium]MBF0542049.1 malate dehydrogenase [Nitrospirota bacterium]